MVTNYWVIRVQFTEGFKYLTSDVDEVVVMFPSFEIAERYRIRDLGEETSETIPLSQAVSQDPKLPLMIGNTWVRTITDHITGLFTQLFPQVSMKKKVESSGNTEEIEDLSWVIVAYEIEKGDGNNPWTFDCRDEDDDINIITSKEEAYARCKEYQDSLSEYIFKAVPLLDGLEIVRNQPNLSDVEEKLPRWNIDDLLDELGGGEDIPF